MPNIISKDITSNSSGLKNNLNFNEYCELNDNNMLPYLNSISKFLPIKNLTEISIEKLSGGTVNNVYRIKSSDLSFILKQSLKYLQKVGKAFPLDYKRMKYEVAYLQITNKIMPNYVPEIYYADTKIMMLVCMQDLNNCEVMRDGLINCTIYPLFEEQLANFLANVLFKASYFKLSFNNYVTLLKKFSSNSLVTLTEDLIFTYPYIDHPSNYLNLPNSFDFNFRFNAKRLYDLFVTRKDTLVHGDLHTGSILINQENAYVFDSEFAMMGPISFDLGLLIGNLLMALVSHKVLNQNFQYHKYLMNITKGFISKFNTKFKLIWGDEQTRRSYTPNSLKFFNKEEFLNCQDKHLALVFSETIGFAGLEICRRVCGITGVEEIREIKDVVLRGKAESIAVDLGIYMVKNYSNIKNLDEIFSQLKQILSK